MFTQPEVCIISDLHIGTHCNSPLWHTTVLNFFDWLKTQLKSCGIRDIIICGDVFHNRNDVSVNTLSTATAAFKKLDDFNIHILVGNHDAFYKDRSDVNSIDILGGWKNITVYKDVAVIDYMGSKLAFCPWGTTIDQIPNADIVFGHFEIASFKMNNFKVCDHGFIAEDLFKKTNMVITGHFHLKEERLYKNGTIIYLGSPVELDWGDKNTTKGIYLLDLLTKKYRFVENTISPKHVEVKLTNLIKNGLATIKDDVKGNIVRFIVDKELETDKIDLIAKKISGYQPIAFDIEHFCFSQTDQTSDVQQTDSGVDITQTIHEFVNAMDIKEKEKVYSYIIELYNKTNQ
jgi:DNA repair exonuclease SbcCD nuclease subunit